MVYNQSIGFLPCASKYSFVLLKGLEPKKPLDAEKGDGYADSMTRCSALDYATSVSRRRLRLLTVLLASLALSVKYRFHRVWMLLAGMFNFIAHSASSSPSILSLYNSKPVSRLMRVL